MNYISILAEDRRLITYKGIGFYIKRAFAYNPFIREAITRKSAQADAAQAVAEAIYSCYAKSEQDKMRAAQRSLYDDQLNSI